MQTTRTARSNPSLLASLAVVACVTTSVAPSSVRAAPIDEKLAALAAAEGTAYVALRDAMLADAETHAALRARVAEARFDDASYQTDALALALVARLDDRDAERAFEGLRGLDPDVYTKFRRPEPIVGRELRDRKVAPGLLVEALLKTARLSTFRDPAREEPAFRRALLVALVDSKHPIARPALTEVMRRGGSLDERASAAVLLGDLGPSVVPALSVTLADRAAPDEVASAAIGGLARTRSTLALSILVDEARSDRSPDRGDAAIRGLGVLGDAWAAAADPSPERDALRAEATRALVELLPSASGTRRVELIALSLAAIAHDDAIALLDAHVQAGGQLGADATLVKRRVARAISRRH